MSTINLWESWVGEASWLTAVVGTLVLFWAVLLPYSVVMLFIDRKLGADLQARVGPNQAGPAGILQFLADAMKLLQKAAVPRVEKKERQNLSTMQRLRERLWLGIITFAVFATISVLPVGSLVLILDVELSALLPIFCVLVAVFAMLSLGLEQGSISGSLGGLRLGAQTLAGLFPAFISLVCVAVRAGGFRWQLFAESQGFGPMDWLVLSQFPFQFIAFIVFFMSGLIIFALPPFDAACECPDLRGGVFSGLYGRDFGLYRFGRFYCLAVWSLVTVVLFLGGWNLPLTLVQNLQESDSWRLMIALESLILVAKISVLILIVAIFSKVMPRIRVDQVTDFAWKVLSPLALLALTGTALSLVMGVMANGGASS